MSFPRQVYEFLKASAIAHAQWDYEISMSIVKNRMKLLILLILLLPIIIVSILEAAPLLGGKEAYAPSFYSPTIFIVSIAIGLAAGLITGCIGAGGGFVVTPALMAAGVKGILAVGTDLFHIFAKAIMGTAVHKKLGNISLRLAIAFLAGSACGTFIGGTINRMLYNANPLLSEGFISLIYTILLGFLGSYALFDFLGSRKGPSAVSTDVHASYHAGATNFAVKLQSVNIAPMIQFDQDFVPGGKRISWVIIASGGAVVGVLASIMGVGGGFVTFPMFVYVFGVSSMTTVGTDILQIIFTAGLASIAQYAIYGYVFYSLAMGMLVGSLFGIQIGALTTKVVKGIHIRGFYAVSILAGFVNRASTLPGKMVELELISIPKPLTAGIEYIGVIVFWVVVAFFTLWMFAKFLSNLRVLKEETTGPKTPAKSPI
jgi:hypothetical protein